MRRTVRFQTILGVRFLVGNAQDAIDATRESGGLVVVPAAPALKNISRDARYREALLGADFAIADSVLMVKLWNFLQGDNIPKLSGLAYLRSLIKQAHFRKPGAAFWIMPSKVSAGRNSGWLVENGVAITDRDQYIAPMYGPSIEDERLLRQLEEHRPRHVVIALGGGVQELLGLYLKRNLSYLPSIHCIGAAIGFLSGDQVRIPVWADKLGLGWLWRTLAAPRRYVPRYWDARRLAPMLFRYREQMPVAEFPVMKTMLESQES